MHMYQQQTSNIHLSMEWSMSIKQVRIWYYWDSGNLYVIVVPLMH